MIEAQFRLAFIQQIITDHYFIILVYYIQLFSTENSIIVLYLAEYYTY